METLDGLRMYDGDGSPLPSMFRSILNTHTRTHGKRYNMQDGRPLVTNHSFKNIECDGYFIYFSIFKFLTYVNIVHIYEVSNKMFGYIL